MIEPRAPSVSVEQQHVVEHPLNRPAVVDAGAGTGKTHTIISRVAYLHESGRCEAKKILLLTFARKAAAELRRRVLELLGPEIEPPHCSTFHAFAASVLAQHAYDLGVSPDSTVIEDIDARLEFRKAFDEVVYGTDIDAAAFPLRSVRRQELARDLFGVAQQLKEERIDIPQFRERALAAADAIPHIPFRVIRPRALGDKLRKPIAETTDEALEEEAMQARARAIAAAEIFARFETRLQARHALTYADLLLLAQAGIAANPRLARLLRGQYLHCIVDEYQDTDRAQHRFLQTLFGDELECVAVVGDPRQSIFGFRGAVPGNVQAFAAMPNCVSYALSENRRSRQEILDIAHAVISEDTGDEQPLTAHRGPAGSQIVHVSSRWASAANAKPNAEENRVAQGAHVAARIAALLGEGLAKPEDIAILSRNKTLLAPFTAALVDAGVPFRLLGGAGYYETAEIRDALAWLRVLADPLDGQALARLASSPACGISDAALAELTATMELDPTSFARRLLVEPVPDELDADSRERLLRLRSIVDALEPFASANLILALSAALDRTGLALQYGSAGDVQAMANLRKLEHLAASFLERNRDAQPIDFVNYMDELAAIEFDDREADPPADDAVSIMTVHAAKGLEWPLVFIIDVWPKNTASRLVWRDAESGALLCREGPDGREPFHVVRARVAPDDKGMAPHESERTDEERDAEERRLFYVALTRARDEVFVYGGRQYSRTNPDGRAHPFIEQVQNWMGLHGWRADEPAAAIERAPAPESNVVCRTLVRPTSHVVCRTLVRPTSPIAALPPLSFSVLHQYERCPRSVTYRVALKLPDLTPSPRSASSGDAIATAAGSEPAGLLAAGDFGRLVHRALERWARDRIAAAPLRPAQAYLDEAMADLNLRTKPGDRKRAASAVHGAIKDLGAWQPVAAEAPFTLQIAGVVVTGFIDLIARDPSGATTILDYKTGEAAASEYALQLGIYREASKRVYGIDDATCAIGRFEKDTFAIERIEPPPPQEVHERIAGIAEGIRTADITPRPGDWCWTCAYRAAPCDAYPKKKPSVTQSSPREVSR